MLQHYPAEDFGHSLRFTCFDTPSSSDPDGSEARTLDQLRRALQRLPDEQRLALIAEMIPQTMSFDCAQQLERLSLQAMDRATELRRQHYLLRKERNDEA